MLCLGYKMPNSRKTPNKAFIIFPLLLNFIIMKNEQVKTEEVENVSNRAQTAPTADTELTEEQLEVVAGGTGYTGGINGGGCTTGTLPDKKWNIHTKEII
jgi:hypothetical protein